MGSDAVPMGHGDHGSHRTMSDKLVAATEDNAGVSWEAFKYKLMARICAMQAQLGLVLVVR